MNQICYKDGKNNKKEENNNLKKKKKKEQLLIDNKNFKIIANVRLMEFICNSFYGEKRLTFLFLEETITKIISFILFFFF